MRAVREHVHSVRDAAPGEGCGEEVGVLRGHVDILGRVPEEEGRRLWRDQRVQRSSSSATEMGRSWVSGWGLRVSLYRRMRESSEASR